MYKYETIKASVFIPKKLNTKLKKIAKKLSMTKSGMIVRMLWEAVENYEDRRKKQL